MEKHDCAVCNEVSSEKVHINRLKVHATQFSLMLRFFKQIKSCESLISECVLKSHMPAFLSPLLYTWVHWKLCRGSFVDGLLPAIAETHFTLLQFFCSLEFYVVSMWAFSVSETSCNTAFHHLYSSKMHAVTLNELILRGITLLPWLGEKPCELSEQPDSAPPPPVSPAPLPSTSSPLLLGLLQGIACHFWLHAAFCCSSC